LTRVKGAVSGARSTATPRPELDAAKTLTAVKAAAKKLQRAKAELKELEALAPGRPKRWRAS
jgi:hypothetical protein